MKKILLIAAITLTVACNTESESSNSQTNTPPTGATDTSAGTQEDPSHPTDSLGGTTRTGQDSAR